MPRTNQKNRSLTKPDKTVDNRYKPGGFAKLADHLDVPALLASLADRHGVRPSDVPTYTPALAALRKAGVDPTKVSPATVAHAGGVWRAGIAETLRRVDEHNVAVLRRLGDTSQIAENGDVRRVRAESASQPPPANGRLVAEKPRKNAIEILGLPPSRLAAAMNAAGFSFTACRAALDELGGIGISDVTIRLAIRRGGPRASRSASSCADALTPEQLAELEPFRDAQPEPKPEKPSRQRPTPVIVPLPARRVEALL